MFCLNLALRARNGITFMLIVGSLLGGAFFGTLYGLEFLANPPVEVLSSRMLTTVLHEGDDIKFLVTSESDINTACDGSITREFYTPFKLEDKEIMEKKRTVGPAPIVHKDETQYVIDVTLPTNMKPGSWGFQGETTYDCGWMHGGMKRLRTPLMYFTLLAKD